MIKYTSATPTDTFLDELDLVAVHYVYLQLVGKQYSSELFAP